MKVIFLFIVMFSGLMFVLIRNTSPKTRTEEVELLDKIKRVRRERHSYVKSVGFEMKQDPTFQRLVNRELYLRRLLLNRTPAPLSEKEFENRTHMQDAIDRLEELTKPFS